MPDFVLIKYIQEKKYLDEFLRGSLYMNSLYNFWADSRIDDARCKKEAYLAEHPEVNPDNVAVEMQNRVFLQEDTLEGVTGYTSQSEGIDSVMQDHRLSDYGYRSVGMGYCKVLCFHTVKFDISPLLSPFMNGRSGFSSVAYDTVPPG